MNNLVIKSSPDYFETKLHLKFQCIDVNYQAWLIYTMVKTLYCYVGAGHQIFQENMMVPLFK